MDRHWGFSTPSCSPFSGWDDPQYAALGSAARILVISPSRCLLIGRRGCQGHPSLSAGDLLVASDAAKRDGTN